MSENELTPVHLTALMNPAPLLEEIGKKIDASVERIRGMKVTTEKEAAALREEAAGLVGIRSSLEQQRIAIVEPFKKATGGVDKAFKIPRDKADVGIGIGEEMLNHFVSSQIVASQQIADKHNTEVDKKHTQAVNRAAKAGREAPPPPAKAVVQQAKTVGGAAVKFVWSFRVENLLALVTDYPDLVEVKGTEVRRMLASKEKSAKNQGIELDPATMISGIVAEKVPDTKI